MAKKHPLKEVFPEPLSAYAKAARPYQKYNVSPAADRTYKGRIYASLRECKRAQELDRLVESGEVAWWLPQVLIPLGEDGSLRIDFQVAKAVVRISEVLTCPASGPIAYFIWGEDPKGAKLLLTKKRKLWNKYGPFPLHIMHADKTIEIWEGKKL